MTFYEISVASDWPHNVYNMYYAYILWSYFPTSLISKFFTPFIFCAGLGIYSTISSCAGCNIFSYRKILQKCFWLSLHWFCTWAMLHWCYTYTKKCSKEESIVSGPRLYYFGKIKRFVWNDVGSRGGEVTRFWPLITNGMSIP